MQNHGPDTITVTELAGSFNNESFNSVIRLSAPIDLAAGSCETITFNIAGTSAAYDCDKQVCGSASNDLIDKVLQLESVTATVGNVHFVFDRVHQKESGLDLIKMASNLTMGTLQFGPRDKVQMNPQSVKVQPLGAKASVQFSEESCIHAGEVIKMKVAFDIEGKGFTLVYQIIDMFESKKTLEIHVVYVGHFSTAILRSFKD